VTIDRPRASFACRTARGALSRVTVGSAFGLTLLAAIPVRAQLSLDKLSITLPLTGGGQPLGIVVVRNTSADPVQALVSVQDWDRDEMGANRFHPLGAVPGSCGRKLRVFPPTLSLDPGAEAAIRISLDSAAQVTRECWSLVVVEKADAPATRGTGVSYHLRTATKVYVEPPGLPLLAEVQSMRVGPMPIERDTVRGIEVKVHNAGGRHLEGTATVQVRRPNNTIVYTVSMPRAYVLPGAIMRLRASFPPLPPGRYLLLALFDYGGEDLAAAQVEHIER
jgi:P pilus assembly chaperone PapD